MTTPSDLSTKLCSRQKKCSDCSKGIILSQTLKGLTGRLCTKCGGTGLIYILDDSVRMPCGHASSGPLSNQEAAEYHAWHDRMCPGWTPSTDLAVWWSALPNQWCVSMERGDGAKGTIVGILVPGQREVEGHALEPLDALKSALVQVMEKEQA